MADYDDDEEDRSNPFQLPDDDKVFLMRDQERRRKAEQREQVKKMKIWEKTTSSSITKRRKVKTKNRKRRRKSQIALHASLGPVDIAHHTNTLEEGPKRNYMKYCASSSTCSVSFAFFLPLFFRIGADRNMTCLPVRFFGACSDRAMLFFSRSSYSCCCCAMRSARTPSRRSFSLPFSA